MFVTVVMERLWLALHRPFENWYLHWCARNAHQTMFTRDRHLCKQCRALLFVCVLAWTMFLPPTCQLTTIRVCMHVKIERAKETGRQRHNRLPREARLCCNFLIVERLRQNLTSYYTVGNIKSWERFSCLCGEKSQCALLAEILSNIVIKRNKLSTKWLRVCMFSNVFVC